MTYSVFGGTLNPAQSINQSTNIHWVPVSPDTSFIVSYQELECLILVVLNQLIVVPVIEFPVNLIMFTSLG